MLYLVLASLFVLHLSSTNADIQVSLENVVAAEGSSLSWNCQLEDNMELSPHNITYWWRYDDARVYNSSTHSVYINGTLYIYDVSLSSVGQYQCGVVAGRQQFYSRTAFLTLAFMAEEFNRDPESHNTSTTQTLSLVCEILSSPPALIVWLHNGNVAQVGGVSHTYRHRSTLFVESTGYNMSGEYRCQATNPVSKQVRFSNIAFIDVRGAPQFLTTSGLVSAKSGATIHLHCHVNGNPPPVVSWTKASSNLPATSSVYQNGTLRLSDLREEDGGFYTCRAINALGSIEHTSLVMFADNSNELPAFSHPPLNVTVIKGQTRTVACLASGNPTPDISWLNPNGTVVASVHFPYNGALQLSPEIAVPGAWSAKATNVAGVVTATFFVTIHEIPSIVATTQALVTNEDLPVELTCRCTATPAPTIIWYLPNGRSLSALTQSPGYQVYDNQSLVIRSAHCVQDHGQFRCLCENEAGSDSMEVILSIQCKPKISVQPTDIEVYKDNSGTLHCAVTGRPKPQLLWYYVQSDSPISSDSIYQVLGNNTLVLKNMRPNMVGAYRCIASNLLGKATFNFTVNMIYKPVFNNEKEYISSPIGSSTVLPCNVNSYPPPTLQWYRNGATVLEDNHVRVTSNSFLFIANISIIHYGTYECVATNSAGSARLQVFLYNTEVMYWIDRPMNTTVKEGESVSIECKVSAPPDTVYIWYFQTSSSSPPHRVDVTSGTLHLQAVSGDNEGIYTCQVTHSNYSLSSSALLTVTADSPSTREKYVKEGADVLMFTSFMSADLVTTVSWYDPEEQLRGEGHSLQLTNVTVDKDHGLWRISRCGSNGCDSETLFLYVEGRPTISNTLTTFNSSHLVIQCLTKGHPLPAVYYYQSQTLISSTGVIAGHYISYVENIKTLIIMKTSLKETYSCLASNVHGSQLTTFTKPKGVKLSIHSTTPYSIAVKWQKEGTSISPPLLGYKLVHNASGSDIEMTLASTEVSYRMLGLSPYTRYSLTLSSYNGLGYSKPAAVYVTTPAAAPGSPIDLSLALKSDHLLVEWRHPAVLNGGADDILYELRGAIDGQFLSQLTTNNTSAFYFSPASGLAVIEVLASNHKSFYTLKSSSAIFESIFVPEENVRAPAVSPPDVNAQLNASNSIVVTWKKIFGITAYAVKVQMPAGRSNTILTNNTSHYTVHNATLGVTYFMQVAGVNTVGTGTYSDPVRVHIPPLPDIPALPDPLADDSPDDLKLTSILAILFGCLFITVVGVVFFLMFIHRRNERKLDEYTDEGFQPSDILGDYQSEWLALSRYICSVSSLQFCRCMQFMRFSCRFARADSPTPAEQKGDGTEEFTPGSISLIGDTVELQKANNVSDLNVGNKSGQGGRSKRIFKVVFTGEERAVDVGAGPQAISTSREPRLGMSEASALELDPRRDLATVVAKLQAETLPDSKNFSKVGVVPRYIRKQNRRREVPLLSPRFYTAPDNTPHDKLTGTMSQRRPLEKKELY